MEIIFVYAQDQAGGIGLNNDLPWRLPHDLQHFKRVTMGHTMVMGRKTFESMNQRLLPGRQTVVITRQEGYGQEIEGLEVLHSVDELFDRPEDKLMVIGGAGLYESLWDRATKIERTYIDARFDCDTFVPALDEQVWTLEESVQGPQDEKNPYIYYYETWVRA